jgi:predicted Zn-dependent peptidase
MYDDDDNTAIYMGLMRQLYHHHPVRDDILGTQESIRTITKDLLERVHTACYHPAKMVLFVAGNVDPETMLSWLHDQNLSLNGLDPCPKPSLPEEPQHVRNASGSRTMDIALPNALMGIKLPVTSDIANEPMKWELAFSIFCDLLIGKSTATYQQFLREGLINDTFGLDITIEPDYGFVLFGSHTTRPDAFLEALRRRILDVDDTSFDVAHFARAKQQIIGQFIQSLNSLEYIANQFTKYEFLGGSLFDVLDIANAITKDDVLAVLPLLQQEERMSVIVIHPKQKQQPAT